MAPDIKRKNVDPSPKDKHVSHANVPSGPALHFVTIMKLMLRVHPFNH